MATSYKVRLTDGSEIGPLDRGAVRSWYEQGLIGNDSLVLTPGSARWSRLGQTMDVQSWKRPVVAVRTKPRSTSAALVGVQPRPRAEAPQQTAWPRRTERRWHLYAGAALLLVAAGLTTLRLLGTTSGEARELEQWTAPERHFADDGLGVALEPPSPWRLLRKDSPLVIAPQQARATFLQPRLRVSAFLLVDAPRGVVSLDHYLERVMAERRAAVPGLKDQSRSDVSVGTLAARRLEATWESEGFRYRDWTTVWTDGWSLLALAAWSPEPRAAEAVKEVEALLRGFSSSGALTARLREAVEHAVAEAPHLTPAAAELLMGQSEARVLEPAETFRRACEAAARSIKLLRADEVREMAQLTAASYAPLGSAERTRLASYLARVRARQLTTPEEDREMSGLVKRGVSKLPEAQRARLREIYERAIQAVILAG